MNKEHPRQRGTGGMCKCRCTCRLGREQQWCVRCADLLSRDAKRNRSLHALLGDLAQHHVRHAELNVDTRWKTVYEQCMCAHTVKLCFSLSLDFVGRLKL